ncbi:MAG: hypothetical protein SGBAC_010835 [Bacillariaceae sp.]
MYSTPKAEARAAAAATANDDEEEHSNDDYEAAAAAAIDDEEEHEEEAVGEEDIGDIIGADKHHINDDTFVGYSPKETGGHCGGKWGVHNPKNCDLSKLKHNNADKKTPCFGKHANKVTIKQTMVDDSDCESDGGYDGGCFSE